MSNYDDVREVLNSRNVENGKMSKEEQRVIAKNSIENSVGEEKNIFVKRSIIPEKVKYIIGGLTAGLVIVASLAVPQSIAQAQSPLKQAEAILESDYNTLSRTQINSLAFDSNNLINAKDEMNYGATVYSAYENGGSKYVDIVFDVVEKVVNSSENYKDVVTYDNMEEYLKKLGFVDQEGKVLYSAYEEYGKQLEDTAREMNAEKRSKL